MAALSKSYLSTKSNSNECIVEDNLKKIKIKKIKLIIIVQLNIKKI